MGYMQFKHYLLYCRMWRRTLPLYFVLDVGIHLHFLLMMQYTYVHFVCVHKILRTTQSIFNRSFIITQMIGHSCQRRYFLPTTYMHVIWGDVLIFVCKIDIAIFLWICFHIIVFVHYNKQIAYLLYFYVHSQCMNNTNIDSKFIAHDAFLE